MTKEQTTDNKETRNIGPIEAYEILMQRTIDENRLLTERTTVFLAASSILFLAFVMLSQSSDTIAPILVKSLRIILSFLGIVLTLVFYSLARGSIKRLEFLCYSQENIERQSPKFTYMTNSKIAPYTDRTEAEKKNRKWKQNGSKIWISECTDEGSWGKFSRYLSKNASKKYIPIIFGILWGTSLIVAVISLVNTS